MLKDFGPVLNNQNISDIVAKYHAQNKKIVFTNGCFDLLHIGHVRYLEQAKSLGDILIVGINTDASVQALKGPTRPIQNEDDRASILAALKSVDHTILFGADTPIDLIKKIRPDFLVKGGDWAVDQIVGSDFVMAYGGQVKSLKFIEGRSTTEIIKKSNS